MNQKAIKPVVLKSKDELNWAIETLKQFHSFKENNFCTFRCDDNFKDKMAEVTKTAGAYLVLAMDSHIETFKVVYIGSSGKLRNIDGKGIISIRKNGIWARLVNGKKQKKNRSVQWNQTMKDRGYSELRIYWIQTLFQEADSDKSKIPLYVEACLMQSYFEQFGRAPEWNLSF